MNDTALSPIHASIEVALPLERAFERFVAEIGRWWPLEYTYTQAQFEQATIEREPGGRWYERDHSGKETAWGDVRAYSPPDRLVLGFAISPQRVLEPPERASEVEIRFRPLANRRTRLEVEHRDLARHGDGAAKLREGMASPQGWPLILAAYARYVRP